MTKLPGIPHRRAVTAFQKAGFRIVRFTDKRAARMAALIIRETAKVMISRFFIMDHEKGKMIAHGNEELKLEDQACKLLK